MYQTITTQILTILGNVTAVKEIFAYPIEGNPNTYPAVVFFPDTLSNVYNSNQENFKEYKYRLWVLVDTSGTDVEDAFTVILPNVVDKIIQAFDTNYSHTIDGHRAWLVIDSGNWGLSVENRATRGYAELSLTYRVSNDI